MPFTVVLSRKAMRDLDNAIDWVARLGAKALQKWEQRYLKAYAALESNPLQYPSADDIAAPDLELRLMTFGQKKHKYRVYFTTAGDTVTIHAIRHAARDSLSEDDL